MPSVYSLPLEIVNPPFQRLETKDFPAVTQEQITDPNNANPMVEGEWVVVADDSDAGSLKRAASNSTYPLLYLGQVGRTDIQTTKKAPVALERPRRIRCKLVSGASSLVAGDEVMIGDVTYDGKTRSGLIKATGTGNYAQGRVLGAGTNTADPDGSYWEILLYPDQRIIP